MQKREAELLAVLAELIEKCKKYGIQTTTIRILANGECFLYGWDGKDKIEVRIKDETPTALTAEESK